MRIFSHILLLVFLLGAGSTRDFGWGDLTNFRYLPDLTPYELRYESGNARRSPEGRPIIRRDAKGRVILLEAEGPGVLVRFAGSPPAGKMYYVVDGGEPAWLAAGTDELFRWDYEINNPIAAGKPEPTQPFPFLWPIAERNFGTTSQVPIPFTRSLQVLSDNPFSDNNYHFTWVRLPATPTSADKLPVPAVVEVVKSSWRHPGEPLKADGMREVRGSIQLTSGQEAIFCTLTGAGAIRSLRVTLRPPNPMLERQLILRCWWDGAPQPSVQVPLGDLCGRQWGMGRPGILGGAHIVRSDPYRNKPPLEHTLYVNLPMPYMRGARLSLQLLGESPVRSLDYVVSYSPHAPSTADGRLCAVYRIGQWEGGEALSVLSTTGRGKLVFVGMANWDYPVGYAWDWQKDCLPELYIDGDLVLKGNDLLSLYYGGSTPLENRVQPSFQLMEPSPRAVSRGFLQDGILFGRSLEARLNRAPGREIGCRFSFIAAWYSEPGVTPSLPGWEATDLYWPTVRTPNAIEAEELVTTAVAENGEIAVNIDTPGRFFLSGRRMVTLIPWSDSARFTFRLPVAKAGQYRLLTRTFHSPSAQSLYDMEVNGKRSQHTFCGFYAKYPGVGLAQAEKDDWGVFSLSPEANVVTLFPQAAYARRQALHEFLFCLDAFLLVPVADGK
ncbi:MAG: DUF2961 domain-containing protein [Armatimonadota bacterium]